MLTGKTEVRTFSAFHYDVAYRKTYGEYLLKLLSGKNGIAMTDPAGMECPVQVTGKEITEETRTLDLMGRETGDSSRTENWMKEYRITAEVSLPAAGIRTFSIKLSDRKNHANKGSVEVEEKLLENAFLRVRLADNGLISSLYDKENHHEFVPKLSAITPMGMNNVIAQSDYGDLWSYYSGPVNGSMLYTQEISDPMPESGINLQRKGLVRTHGTDANAMGLPEIRILESGPVRTCIEVINPDIKFTTKIYLARNEKMLRFKTTFIPTGKRYRIRVAFPTSIKNGRIVHSIPFGFIERKEGEYPAQNWMEYFDAEKGLCLLNRGIPGNNVTDGVMMLSLFRAVAMEDTGKNGEWFEEGVEHTFEYALRPFGNKDRQYNPARTGEMFNHPFHAVCADNSGDIPESAGFIELKSECAELSCIKRHGGEIEVRLYETAGKGGKAVLSSSFKIASCRIVDMKYRNMQEVKAKDGLVTLKLKPFQIVTCLLRKVQH